MWSQGRNSGAIELPTELPPGCPQAPWASPREARAGPGGGVTAQVQPGTPVGRALAWSGKGWGRGGSVELRGLGLGAGSSH